MKILHVLSYPPTPPEFGGALRIFHLLRGMTQRHEVTVLMYGSPGDDVAVCRSLSSVKEVIVLPPPWTRVYRRVGQIYSLCTRRSHFYHVGHTEYMQNAIDQCCDRTEYDLIQTEFSTMGSFRFPSGPVKILDAHNVEFENFERMARNGHTALRSFFYRREYQKTMEEEIAACMRHDALFVTSERDKAVFDRHLPGLAKVVIPNGVDTRYFHPGAPASRLDSLVFTGMMGYVPNYDGVLYFLDAIFPRVLRKHPHAKLTVVGSNPPAALLRRASNRVIVTGHVPDVRPYVWNAGVYVIPLRMGSGTRLKALEALAMMKPIVTTSIGCEGIDVEHKTSAMIADDPDVFADTVSELILNSDLRTRLTANGYDLVRQRYEWSVIHQQVEDAYGALCRQRGGNKQPQPENAHATV